MVIQEKQIGRLILKVKRQFYIQQKAIFEAAIIAYVRTLPEPVLNNPKRGQAVIDWPNSRILMEKRDKFLKYCLFKRPLWRAVWKILIVKSDYDPAYRDAGQFILEELVEAILHGDWKPRPVNNPPASIWKEPGTQEGGYGAFHGRTFKQYIKGGDNL